MRKSILSLSLLSLLLSGCGNLTGYDAGDHFACAAPKGVSCMSMTGVYANVQAGNIGAVKSASVASEPTPKSDASGRDTSGRIDHAAISSGTPLRTQPHQLRAWLAPWPDADGDIHDQSYLYMVIDSGRWVMERVRSEIIQQFAPGAEPSIRPVGMAPAAVPGVKPGDAKPDTPKPAANATSPSNQVPNFSDMLKKVGVSNGNS